MSDDIRWIRSYVMAEEDGTLGTVCIYQASSEDKIREHAQRAGLAGRRGHQGRGHRARASGPGRRA